MEQLDFFFKWQLEQRVHVPRNPPQNYLRVQRIGTLECLHPVSCNCVHIVLPDTNNYYPTEWCKVFCKEDNKCHDTTTRNLEPEDSEILKETDLVVGNSLIWKKYNTTVIEIYGNCRYTTSPLPFTPHSHVPACIPQGCVPHHSNHGHTSLYNFRP